jgi:uncharacterized lipoprotein YajG
MKALKGLFFLLFLSTFSGCSTSPKPATQTPPLPNVETSSQKEDVVNVVSGNFAAILAEVEGKELDPKDPEQSLAESLDQLEVNSFVPSGVSISDAITILAILTFGNAKKWKFAGCNCIFLNRKCSCTPLL